MIRFLRMSGDMYMIRSLSMSGDMHMVLPFLSMSGAGRKPAGGYISAFAFSRALSLK